MVTSLLIMWLSCWISFCPQHFHVSWENLQTNILVRRWAALFLLGSQYLYGASRADHHSHIPISCAITTSPLVVSQNYVDNILEVVANDAVVNLTEHLKQVDDTSSIKFTYKEEDEGKILVCHDNGPAKLLVYR